MSRRAALRFLLLSASGCARPRQAAPAPRGVHALLTVGHDFGESTRDEESVAWTELQRIAEIAQRARSEEAAPADALIRTLYTTLSFVREVEDSELSFVLLPSVLRRRRGSCVGLGTLYLALAEMLGVPSAGVLLPGHFFVRVAEHGRQRNVELLRQGEEMQDAWYRERYPVPVGKVAAYGRLLSADEVLGVVEYDVGNQRRRRGRLHDARRAYQRAARHFPDFAEAQASLGAVLHLLGALEEAGAAYRAAERANPWLPGLEKNVELLLQERAGRVGDSPR